MTSTDLFASNEFRELPAKLGWDDLLYHPTAFVRSLSITLNPDESPVLLVEYTPGSEPPK